MRIRWTVPAVDDLQHIKNYLQQNYPHFAEPTVRTIYQRIRSLKTSPNRGRPGHRSGTRELAITPLPYVVVYAVKAEAVEILHIYILRWDSKEIIAVDSSPICIVNTLRVDLITKRITLSSSDKGVTKDPFCKGSDKLSTAVLWGEEDISKEAINRAKAKRQNH